MITLNATRYITPLREGGSLPAIVEADDGQLYVLKFRGAGQGPKALIAELVAGELGRALGLPVPNIVFIELDAMLGRSEPDEEIQELVQKSAGLNLGMAYLSGALAFEPLKTTPELVAQASEIVWFDAYVTNVDRTPRNTNLLVVDGKLWLIDHGATLYFQHIDSDYLARSHSRFPQIKDHVLLRYANNIAGADARLSALLTEDVIRAIVALIPDSWLDDPGFENHTAHRQAYVAYLLARLDAPRGFVEEAINARERLV